MLIQIILLILFSIIAILVGFLFPYLLILSKGKKQVKEQVVFGEEQARTMYLMYKGKNPTEQQIQAMIAAYKNNKI
ncbi:MAG: hypothetical protein LBQ45_02220 [Mycoplasmataceae bacterium]|jgi:uncharacterized protein YneF (UPF0154 family)|nr:hypothetical protein [Mycoplasmataceae bacterium]